MNKKSFSLIEIIFSLVLISVIATVAITKFDTSLENTHYAKIKSDIFQIREGINNHKNKMILKNEIESFTSLDENNQKLFSKILNAPIFASNQKKATAWSKFSKTQYNVYLDATHSLIFTFDSQNYTFDCDHTNDICKKLFL